MVDFIDLYKKRVTISGSTAQDRIINYEKRIFDEYLKNSPNKYTIEIDNNVYDVTIQDNSFSKNDDDKILLTYIDNNIECGNYFIWNNNYWLVVLIESPTIPSYKKMRISKCNHILKFYNNKQQLVEYPSIITNKTTNIEENNYIILPNNQFYIILSANEDTKKIDYDNRFIFNGQAWKVIGFNRMKQGLIELTVEITEINQNDDLENEIADRWKYEIPHEYILTIINSENVTISQNNTLQLQVELTDNGVLVENPELIYISDNPDIVSVDENGLVTGLNVGQANIIVKLSSDENISDSILIEVSDVIEDSWVLDIVGRSNVLIGSNEIYNCIVYNNGVVVDDKFVIFELSNNLADIISQENNICTIQFGSNLGDIELIAKLEVDNEVIEKIFTIKINGFW